MPLPPPRSLEGLDDTRAALGAAVRALPGAADDPRESAVDPREFQVQGPLQGSQVFGTSQDPDEQAVLSGELPMREATVKKRVVDEAGNEDFEDDVQYGVDMRELRNRLARAMATSELNRRRGQDATYDPSPEE